MKGLYLSLGQFFKARCFRGFKEQRTSLSRDGGLEAPLAGLGLRQVEGAVWVGWE